jgi:hypothetical protein
MKNIFQKKEDEEVKERCNQLKEILRKIDEIWNPVIRIDRIDFNNKKIQDKSMERILILFEYNLKDFSRIIKESYPFKNESFNFYDYTNISKWDEKTKQINGYDQKNLFNKLIFDVLPKWKIFHMVHMKKKLPNGFIYFNKLIQQIMSNKQFY